MLNLFLRILLSFLLLFTGLRLLGKKQLGELTAYNIATLAAVGQMASDLATDTHTSLFPYVVALISYFLLTFLISFISLKSSSARKLFEGSPIIVVANGKILERNLKSLNMSIDNLTEKLREEKVFNIQDTEFVIMEPNGKLSVLLKPPYQPVTADIMKLPTKYQGLPTVLIKDGKILENDLKELNLSKDWLNQQLKARNINNIPDVFLAQLDHAGQLYIDLNSDWK